MRLGTWKLPALLLAAMVCGGPAVSRSDAASLLSSTFDAPTYADGTLATSATVGQDGWVQTGGVATNPIQVSNTATNGLVSLLTTGQDVSHALSSATTSGSVYVGADINLTAAQATGDYFLHLADTNAGTGFFARLFAKSSGAGYVLGIQTSNAGVAYGATVLPFGTTKRVVVRYDFIAGTQNDSSALYVSPTDTAVEANNTAEATNGYGTGSTNADPASIAALNLRQGTAANAATLTIDNIGVGTTFTDAAVAVPEPASIGLLGAAVGLLGLRRRRR